MATSSDVNSAMDSKVTRQFMLIMYTATAQLVFHLPVSLGHLRIGPVRHLLGKDLTVMTTHLLVCFQHPTSLARQPIGLHIS